MRINNAFSSIRWKLVIAFLLIIGIAFGVINFSVTSIVEKYLVDQRVNEQQKIADRLAIQMAPYLEKADAETMLRIAIQNGQNLNGRVLVLSHDGVVQTDGFSALNGMKLDHREIVDVLSGSKDRSYGFHRIDSLTNHETKPTWVSYYTSVITYNTRRIGVLVLSTSIQDVEDKIQEISARIIIYSFIVSMLVAFMSFIISGLITKPIVELTQVINQMSKGQFNQRVKVVGRNELGQLALAFNMMSEKLEDLDKARNEFVSNASHELKTPLSSMKILIESLIHQDVIDAEIYKEFLGDVNSEIDRLTAIINDLLSLVHIDKQDMVLSSEEVALGDLISQTVKKLMPLAKEKDIGIEIIVQENVLVEGDRLKLQQVISNLVDNGVKYTPPGGKVQVQLYRRGRKAILEVKDTGYGIPAEDIPHIFERFFRVDKARSRVTGGTGLGLSIVHRIVFLHGGDIMVSSEEGKGTTFWVELPVV